MLIVGGHIVEVSLDADLVGDLKCFPEEPDHGVWAAVVARDGVSAGHVPDDVGLKQLSERVHVAAVEKAS